MTHQTTPQTIHIAIAAAGTSGHIRPAWVLGKQAEERGMKVSWVGSARDTWRPPENWTRTEINMQGIRNHGLRRWLTLPWTLFRAVWQIRKAFAKQRPDLVILMGGYVTLPVAVVAKLMGIPYVVFEQNTVLCLSNRCVRPFAKAVFAGLPLKAGQPKAEWVNNPLPADWESLAANNKKNTASSEVVGNGSRAQPAIKVLIMGGSQGAQAINRRLPVLLEPWAESIEIVHVTGERHLESVKALYADLGLPAKCIGYQDCLGEVLAWADIAIMRSGAMSITECLAFALPSILIPLPGASDNHQLHNAEWFASLGGGRVVLEDSSFEDNLKSSLEAMLEPSVLSSMRDKLLSAQHPFDNALFWHMIDLAPIRQE